MDARQIVDRELVLLVRDEIEQQHRLRRRIVAADARALVFLLLVARIGHEALQLAGPALVVGLRRREHDQPVAVRRERGAFDLDVVADVERLRRAARVGLGEFLVVLLLRVAVVLDRAQRREVLELQLAEIVRLLRVRILLGLDDRGRAADAGSDVVGEPVAAAAVVQHAAVARELGRAFHLRRARDLRQASARDVADEHVAVADERAVRARAVEHRVGAVGVGHRLRIDDRVLAGGDVDAVQIAHLRALLLQAVVEALAVDAPVRMLDRRADPVWVGHRLLDRDRLRGRSGEDEQGDECGKRRARHGCSRKQNAKDSGLGRPGIGRK